MKYLNLPPKIKVLEALGAIADNRVRSLGGNFYEVLSSEGDRKYRVYVNLSLGEACSTDNGTTYRDYVGYPIIAVLMLEGVLPYDEEVSKALAGIKWKELNTKYKNYAIVENIVKQNVMRKGVSEVKVEELSKNVLTKLKTIKLRKSNICYTNLVT